MIEYLMIGEVLKPQGIRGEVKIKPYAANPDDFRRWKTLYVRAGEVYAPGTDLAALELKPGAALDVFKLTAGG